MVKLKVVDKEILIKTFQAELESNQELLEQLQESSESEDEYIILGFVEALEHAIDTIRKEKYYEL